MSQRQLRSESEMANAQIAPDKLSRYSEIKLEARALYDSFKAVQCPALKNAEVHFTSEGFNHLVYRIPKQERDRRVQIMRFELLGKAKELLATTTTIQEYEEYVDQAKGWM
jgi:hypothetical protein